MATASPLRVSPLQPSDWIRAGFAQLAREGIESVRIEVLARELKVSKGSFYWHFRDRDELLMQMLARWESVEGEWLSGEESLRTDEPQAAIRWARFVDRNSEADRIREEIAVRAWARRDERVAVRVASIEQRKARIIAKVLAEIGFAPEAAESWSETIMLLYLGWLDRTARNDQSREPTRGLGEILSDVVLAASTKVTNR